MSEKIYKGYIIDKSLKSRNFTCTFIAETN